jgi:RNA polymerase sigma factor (sigma-70 family)
VKREFDRLSDAELIKAVREGDTDAYGVLYERHLMAAKRAAACLARKPVEREDLIADAFARVLRALRDGNGPNEEFRAYLLVTMRNAAITTSRGAHVSLYADVPETYMSRPHGDPVLNRWNAMTAATAFATLPERWRTVLWHTEVEEETPAEIAPLLGMRPNGVAALAYRAREGLRQAYLRAHLPNVEGRECRATVSKLAGWVRQSVPVPLGRRISRHLAVCSDCRARADTLSKVNEELRASVAPVLLGAAFAAAYAPAVAAPVSGAAVKTLLAKVAVAIAIAATAMTTVASAPNVADSSPAPVPALADPNRATDTIEGPSATTPARDTRGNGTPGAGSPGSGAPGAGSPARPTAPTPPAGDSTPGANAPAKDEKAADKADKKADKAADKAEKAADKAEKEAAKETKKNK